MAIPCVLPRLQTILYIVHPANDNIFFIKAKSKSDIVATFLAVLELAKTKRITVDGDMHNPTVQIVNEANEVEAVE